MFCGIPICGMLVVGGVGACSGVCVPLSRCGVNYTTIWNVPHLAE